MVAYECLKLGVLDVQDTYLIGTLHRLFCNMCRPYYCLYHLLPAAHLLDNQPETVNTLLVCQNTTQIHTTSPL